MAYTFTGVFLVFSGLVLARNPVWEDDFTLFTTDVNISVNSAKSNCTAGGKMMEEALLQKDTLVKARMFMQAEAWLKKAIEIYPGYNDALLLLGNLSWHYRNDYKKSAEYYFRILDKSPMHATALGNLDLVLRGIKDIDFKIAAYEKMLSISPCSYEAWYQLGVAYGRYKSDLQKSQQYLEKALMINPSKVEAYKDLGVVYGMQKKYSEAAEVLKKALVLNASDDEVYYNLGVTMAMQGKNSDANYYFNLADSVKRAK